MPSLDTWEVNLSYHYRDVKTTHRYVGIQVQSDHKVYIPARHIAGHVVQLRTVALVCTCVRLMSSNCSNTGEVGELNAAV